MKKSEFLQAVKVEATHLREYATKTEKERLSFACLRPSNISSCIYGQLTGNCSSERAIELAPKILDTWESINIGPSESIPYDNFKDLKVEKGNYYTALEIYIMTKGSKRKKLIEFIKGETDTFNP